MDAEKVYDDYWASGLHVWEQWTEEEFKRWMSPLAGRENVLDYGCGMGLGYQPCLVKAVKKYSGADVSEMSLADLRKKGFDAFKIDTQTSKINCPDNTFDGAVCSEVFEHLYDPLAAAREIHRVMKPGGVFVATVPNFGYHAWRVLAFMRAQVPAEPDRPKENRFNGVHIRFFSRLMFRRLFRVLVLKMSVSAATAHRRSGMCFKPGRHFAILLRSHGNTFPARSILDF